MLIKDSIDSINKILALSISEKINLAKEALGIIILELVDDDFEPDEIDEVITDLARIAERVNLLKEPGFILFKRASDIEITKENFYKSDLYLNDPEGETAEGYLESVFCSYNYRTVRAIAVFITCILASSGSINDDGMSLIEFIFTLIDDD